MVALLPTTPTVRVVVVRLIYFCREPPCFLRRRVIFLLSTTLFRKTCAAASRTIPFILSSSHLIIHLRNIKTKIHRDFSRRSSLPHFTLTVLEQFYLVLTPLEKDLITGLLIPSISRCLTIQPPLAFLHLPLALAVDELYLGKDCRVQISIYLVKSIPCGSS